MKTLKDLGDLKGKRVLMRADFNVPLDGTTITDDGRIKAALPTITALREEGAKVILMAHLGRPKGKVVPELSLAPVAKRLGELLGVEVPLAKDTYGEDAQAKVAAMNDGDVVLLENVRFNPEETSKDPAVRAPYAKKIAALGEVFVSDGFGVVHRAQGSDYDVAADLPAAAGKLVEKEVKALSKATENPERRLQDRRVERPDGRVRGSRVRRRHQGRGAGPRRRDRGRRIHHRRWWRLRLRRAQPRLPGGRLLAHLHRWRCLP